MNQHPDCPLGADGFPEIIRELATISATLKNMESNSKESEIRLVSAVEKLESSHGKRIEKLESIEGRHGMIAAVISATIAGLALFGKYLIGGKG